MIIFMWSGPRNLSTALMRSFENRNDTTVWDEPFYSYYLKETGFNHPMKEKIIKLHLSDEKKIIKKIKSSPGNNKIFYQKHITHHILKKTNIDWIYNGINCFLIRHPAKVIKSYIKKMNLNNINDIGFEKQFEIFNLIKKHEGKTPIVINSDNLLKNPKKQLHKICYKLNISYTDKMIKWPKGSRKTDGIWGKIWYENVNQSNTFNKFKKANKTIPSKYKNIYLQSLKIYNSMNKYSI